MKTARRLIAALLATFAMALPYSAMAQGQVGNFGNYDRKLYHWGIQVGIVQTKFDLNFSSDEDLRTTLQGATSYYTPGFHIAIIMGELRLGNYFNLRLVPGVTIITRQLSYSWEDGYLQLHPSAERSRNVESVYGDIPLELKFRAVRYGNFRPYLVGGVSYGFDIASLRKNRNRTDEAIVRLVPSDFRYSAGVGFDFFLRYVKFAIELKVSLGLIDLKVNDPDIHIRAADNLYSRAILFSFNFQG